MLITVAGCGGDAPPPRPLPPPSVQLQVSGHLLEAADQRFLLKGATAYLLPFYTADGGQVDEALQATSRRQFDQRDSVFAAMREIGVNTVRVPLATEGFVGDPYRLGGEQAYLDRLRAIVASAEAHQLRVILSWWDSLGLKQDWPERYREAFPMMRAVRQALGDNPAVLYEPFNEPNEVTWEEWTPVMTDTVRFWRTELGYRGPLIIDTIGWSWDFDPDRARALQQVDRTLIGESQLVFANHRYANANTCFCGNEKKAWQDTVGRHVGTFPLVGTEYGWYNHQGPPRPRWNEEFFEHLATKAVPAGFNGAVTFVWDWVDENSMTEPGTNELNENGRKAVEHFYRKAR